MPLRRVIAILAAGLIGSAGLLAATTHTKKSRHPKPAAHVSKKTPSAHVSKKAAPAARRRTAHKGSTRPAHATRSAWRPGQTAPTPERYKEIQEALAKKGYLHGDATGVWNQDSADALRRFQHDQNLEASGKLDSLSIIALGLGPKY